MKAATGLGAESDADDVYVAVLRMVCGVVGLSEMRKCVWLSVLDLTRHHPFL